MRIEQNITERKSRIKKWHSTEKDDSTYKRDLQKRIIDKLGSRKYE